MDSGGGGGGSHKAASGSAPSAAAAAAAPNPTAMLSALMGKRAKLQEEVRSIERQSGEININGHTSARQVYDMETNYLQESNQFGSVLKGFESFLSSSKNTANLKRSRKFQVDERLFSLSSVTSPAVEEQLAARDEAREYAGRSKGASTPANGQGKPKKGGRPGGRDGKRIRPSNDPDLDDEDDY